MKVRYIGQSSCGLRRYNNHFTPSSLKIDTPKNKWIKELMEDGLFPGFVIVEVCDFYSLNDREKYWISHFKSKSLFFNLLNVAEGGSGGNTGKAKKLQIPVYSICKNTGARKDYPFVWKTAEDGFNPSKVVAVCKKKRLSHLGHMFFYASENANETLVQKYVPKTTKPIRSVNKKTGEQKTFDSIKTAAKALNLCATTISHHINGKSKCSKYDFFL